METAMRTSSSALLLCLIQRGLTVIVPDSVKNISIPVNEDPGSRSYGPFASYYPRPGPPGSHIGYGDDSVEWEIGKNPWRRRSVCPGRGVPEFGRYSTCIVCDSLTWDCDSTDDKELKRYEFSALSDCPGFCITVYREDGGEFKSPEEVGRGRNVTFYRTHLTPSLYQSIKDYKAYQRYCSKMNTGNGQTPMIVCVCDYESVENVDRKRQSCNNFTAGYLKDRPNKQPTHIQSYDVEERNSVNLSQAASHWTMGTRLVVSLLSVLPSLLASSLPY